MLVTALWENKKAQTITKLLHHTKFFSVSITKYLNLDLRKLILCFPLQETVYLKQVTYVNGISLCDRFLPVTDLH